MDYRLDPPDDRLPCCPVCGEECETLFIKDRDIIGCECCISTVDSAEYLEEKYREEREEYQLMFEDYL